MDVTERDGMQTGDGPAGCEGAGLCFNASVTLVEGFNLPAGEFCSFFLQSF